jgi:hypothetical protein
MGSQTGVLLIVHYNKHTLLKNNIILTTSGAFDSWARFTQSSECYDVTQAQTFPLTTVSTPSDDAVLVIKIPSDVQTGSCEITVKGTNSLGSTSSVTYVLIVT